jgi:ankyrin repeat protein
MTTHDELVEAIEANAAVTVKRLLLAHPDLANSPDWTPPPLHYAILWNKPEMVELLLDHGANIELRDPDRDTPPLRYAIVFGRRDVIPILLARGANVGQVDANGTTALQLAKNAAGGCFAEFEDLPRKEAYAEIVDLLIDLGVQ